MESLGLKKSNEKEKPRNKVLPWAKRIIGIGALAGGLAFAGDQAWDQYQETQRHKERKEYKKKNIELADELLHRNVFDLRDNTADPEIGKSVDSLSDLLESLENQKKIGVVDYETIEKVRVMTESLESRIDSASQDNELLPTLNLIKENIKEISHLEMSKELSGYMDDFLNVLSDKEVLGAISKHPRGVERILESIEEYKNTFADYYVDPTNYGRDFEVMSRIDSLYQTELSEHKRLFHTLMSMYKEGSLNDFFESLGTKVNVALTAARFDGKISLGKNFLESANVECEKWIDENPDFENKIEKSMTIPPSRQELVDALLTEMIYYEGYEFYSLFSADNSGAIQDLTSEIEKSDNLTQIQKEKVIHAIEDLGKKIGEFVLRLENQETGNNASVE